MWWRLAFAGVLLAGCAGSSDASGSTPAHTAASSFDRALDQMCRTAVAAEEAYLERPDATEAGLFEVHVRALAGLEDLPAPPDRDRWPLALSSLYDQARSVTGEGEDLLQGVWPFIGAARAGGLITCGDTGQPGPSGTPSALDQDEFDAGMTAAFEAFMRAHDAYHEEIQPTEQGRLLEGHGPGILDVYRPYLEAVLATPPPAGRRNEVAVMRSFLSQAVEDFGAGIARGVGQGEARFAAGFVDDWQFAGAACLAGWQAVCPGR